MNRVFFQETRCLRADAADPGCVGCGLRRGAFARVRRLSLIAPVRERVVAGSYGSWPKLNVGTKTVPSGSGDIEQEASTTARLAPPTT